MWSGTPIGYEIPSTPIGDITGDGVPDVVVAQARQDVGTIFEAAIVSIFNGASFHERGQL